MFVPRDVTLNKSLNQLMEYPVSASGGFSVSAYSGNGGMTAGGMNSVTQSVTSSNATIPLLQGILPQDQLSRYRLYRDMYDHDPVSGGAVDVLSSFLGEFHLTGVSDQSRLDKFAATAASINPSTLFEVITREYLVHGQFIGTKIFDKRKGYITAISPHSALSVTSNTLPVHGSTPIFDLHIDDSFKKMLKSDDPRIREVISGLPPFYQNALGNGSIPLTPQNTIFFPRQRMSGDVMGTSLFERTLAVWLIEKNLFKGTIDASNRRQRSILHAMVSGDQDWEPQKKDFDAITQAIKQADMDPQGAVMTTRDNIQVSQFMEPQDFWSIDQISGWASQMKFYAYRVSPEIINGQASLSTLDASLSIMVNDLRQYRSMFEHKIIQESIFGDVAIANGFKRKDGHRSGMLASDKRYGRQLFNLADYELPNIIWKQSLSPEGDSSYLNMLHDITEMGVPVPLSMYAAAAGLNVEDLISGSDKDIDTRKKAAKIWKEIARNSSDMVKNQVSQEEQLKMQEKQASAQGQEQNQQEAQEQGAQETTAHLASLASLNTGMKRKGWDEREWDRDNQGFHNTDNMGRRITGTPQGDKDRRDAALRMIAERLAEEARKRKHETKEAEWQAKHS